MIGDDSRGWVYESSTGGFRYTIRYCEVRVRRLADDGPAAWDLTAASDRYHRSEYSDLSDISVNIGCYPTQDEAMTAGEEVLSQNGVFDLVSSADGTFVAGVRNPYPRPGTPE